MLSEDAEFNTDQEEMSAKNNFSMGGKVILLLLFVNYDHLSDNWPDRKICIFYEKQSSPCGHQTFYDLSI